MQTVLKFLDDLWNIRWVTGHRTQVAMWGLKIAAVVLSYQGIATAKDLIAAGINLPDVPSTVLLWASPLPAYFAAKVEQFAKAHKPT